MRQITTGSVPWRTAHARLAAALIGVGLYVVGGGLLLAHLSVRGTGPVDLPDREVLSERVSVQLSTRRAVDRGASSVLPVRVSLVDGATYICLVPADQVSADALVVSVDTFVAMAPAFDCR